MGSKITKFKNNLWYLVFWPVYIVTFVGLERLMDGRTFHLVHCFIDDLIPFNELFVIPYLSWHVLIPLTLYYTLIYETDNFRNLMKYFILTFVVTMVIYLVYPTYLNLRPETFERDNILTWIVGFVYTVDTPTNVCPSLHIIGSLGLLFASWDTRGRGSRVRQAIMIILVIFICLSTMFMKQHSFIDVLTALPVSFVGWIICFRGKEMEKFNEEHQW